MNATQFFSQQSFERVAGSALRRLAPALAILSLLAKCLGQGTLTINFDSGYGVPPPGYRVPTAGYSESGVEFWNPYGLENLVLTGSGIAGYPDDGTDYLQVSQGARLGFEFSSGAPFDLLSFDAAAYASYAPGPVTLHVVGYTTPSLYPGVSVDLTANGLNFQTFTFDSSFQHLYRVDILSDLFSLDNVVLGVPEPSVGALLGLGCLSALGYARFGRKRPPRP